MKFKVFFVFLLLGLFNAQSGERVTVIHHDHLGSPIIKSDEQGNVIWRANNKPYGQEQNLSPNEIKHSPLQYTGSPYDSYSGLNYMKARYYHPEIGRFMAMDLIGFRANNIISFNAYTYANNNPYKYIDPTGMIDAEASSASAIAGEFDNGKSFGDIVKEVSDAYSDFSMSYDEAFGDNPLGVLGGFAIKGVGFGLKAITKLSSKKGVPKGAVDPSIIRFSQDSIKGTFRDGRSVQDLAAGLKNGTIKASDVPAIRTVQRNGQTISIDNRRLAAFRKAGEPIRTRPATAKEAAQAQRQGNFSAG